MSRRRDRGAPTMAADERPVHGDQRPRRRTGVRVEDCRGTGAETGDVLRLARRAVDFTFWEFDVVLPCGTRTEPRATATVDLIDIIPKMLYVVCPPSIRRRPALDGSGIHRITGILKHDNGPTVWSFSNSAPEIVVLWLMRLVIPSGPRMIAGSISAFCSSQIEGSPRGSAFEYFTQG